MAPDVDISEENDFSRPLTSLEREVIESILRQDFHGVRELRAQLETARVRGTLASKYSPSIDLTISQNSPRAPISGSILPVDAYVYDNQGNYLGELIVWVSDGKLSALEYAWVTNSAPHSLPLPAMLRVSLR